MKKYFICLIFVIFLTNFIFSEKILHKKLYNGMDLIVKENFTNNSCALYCFVKTGSMFEENYLGAGISHYLEHIISGGTTKFRKEIDYDTLATKYGAIINAYTSLDRTVYHIQVDSEAFDAFLQVMYEQLFFPAFDSLEVAREKEVILKEIVMRHTAPLSQVVQRFRERAYPNTNFIYPISGYPELFKKLTRDDLIKYYNKHYMPNNMIFVAVGNFNADSVMNKLENKFKDIERKNLNPVTIQSEYLHNGETIFYEEFDIKQPIVYISYLLPETSFQEEKEIDLITDYLTSKRNSPLKKKLVLDLKLVNDIYSIIDFSTRTKKYEIRFYFEPKNVDKIDEIIKIIDSELINISKNGLNKDELKKLIESNKSKILMLDYDCTLEARNLGEYLLEENKIMNLENMLKEYDNINLNQIDEIYKKYFLSKKRLIYIALPKGTSEIYEKNLTKEKIETKVEKISLKNKNTIIYKNIPESKIVYSTIYLPISTSYENVENAGTLEFVAKLIFKESKKYSSEFINEWLNDHGAKFDVKLNDFGLFIEIQCLKKDFNELINIIKDCVKNPAFTEKEIELMKKDYESNYKRNLAKPNELHNEFRKSIMYKGTPNGMSSKDKFKIISNLTRNDIFDIYKKFFKIENMKLSLFGDYSKIEAENYFYSIYNSVPKGIIESKLNENSIQILNEKFINKYSFEQVHIDIVLPAPKKNDEDYWTMTLINAILTGSRGRIYYATRRENDLAYTAQSSYIYRDEYGFLRIFGQTSYDKKDKMIEVLLDEIKKLKTEKFTQDYIENIANEEVKISKSLMTDKKMSFNNLFYEAINVGYDFVDKMEENLKKVTPEDIIRVANKYFTKTAIFISEPENIEKIIVK